MAKVCTTLNELLESVGKLISDPKAKENYDLGRTNYFDLVPEDGILPKVKDEITKWRLLGKSSDSRPMISFLIDRRWVTVKWSNGKDVWKQDFQCKANHPVDVLRSIFEWKSYGWAENLSFSFFLFL